MLYKAYVLMQGVQRINVREWTWYLSIQLSFYNPQKRFRVFFIHVFIVFIPEIL